MDPQLDEQFFKNEQLLASWGGLNDNNVHIYFLHSPFCDITSNNALIAGQAQANQNMAHIWQSRQKFEDELRARNGLEYMVEAGPDRTADGGDTGVWIIKKQRREKRPDGKDELTQMGINYVMDNAIYQAPTLDKILTARIVRLAALQADCCD